MRDREGVRERYPICEGGGGGSRYERRGLGEGGRLDIKERGGRNTQYDRGGRGKGGLKMKRGAEERIDMRNGGGGGGCSV